MLEQKLKNLIGNYDDFPKKGILFRDIMPLLQDQNLFIELIRNMGEMQIIKESEAIVAIDARGFIFGSAISFFTKKPLIAARKPGKLPGELLLSSYKLEYGENTLCLQKKSLLNFEKFCIVDDLLATGGTAACVEKMLNTMDKTVTGLAVVIELCDLQGKKSLDCDVDSIVKY